MLPFDPRRVETPAYVIDLGRLRRNLAILDQVQRRTGARVLLALKGYAAYCTFPWVRRVLAGAAASSVHEARLAREWIDKEVHAYAPAYSERDMEELVELVDHVVFNSVAQLRRFHATVKNQKSTIQVGLRVNPEHRETEVALYDPCAPGSRLGVPRRGLDGERLEGLDGLHFHNLCERDSDALERTLNAVLSQFEPLLEQTSWINFGGGHRLTRPDYDMERLVRVVVEFQSRWDKTVYLEPGSAVGWDVGWLVSSVLDVVDYGSPIAILDTSVTAHMPDVLEMPYRPGVLDASAPGEKAVTVRLGGLSCLAGDVVGDYSFDKLPELGDRIVFEDMAHYTMVKTTTFNGVRLPSIVTYEPETDELTVVRRFGYADYATRLS